MKIGYACINMSTNYSTNRGMIKKTFIEKGLDYASELALKNVLDLERIVKWNNFNNIDFYRITSCLFPWMSEYNLKDLKDYEEIKNILNRIGEFANNTNQRLTFHPDHFVNLSSPREDVVLNSIKDVEQHSEIGDMLLFKNSPYNKINIHIGGSYGDKTSAKNRFVENYNKLSKTLKSRLTIENDSKKSLYNIFDLCEIYEKTGIPIVLDLHHLKLNSENLTIKDAMEFSFLTWEKETPVVHLSEGDSHKHNEYIENLIETYGYNFDIMIEAKAKELSVLKYKELLKEKCYA